MPAPDISLVLCTRNRAAQLGPCLQTVAALKYDGPWEVVLVDNGSTDETLSILEAFRDGAPVDVRVITEPRRGQARARNTGIAAARGRVLCFTDDDCYPSPDLLATVARVFSDPSVGYAGGRVLLYDPTDARTTVQESTEPRVYRPGDPIPAGDISGANFAFTAEACARVGGFDPLLGPGTPLCAGDDTDFFASLSAAGFEGRYVPEMVVHHHHGRKRGPEVNRIRLGYDKARGAAYFKALLRRPTRRAYASLWWGRVREGKLRRTLREVGGALLYLRLSRFGRRA